VCEAAICYTGDILDQTRPKYSLKYYVGLAKQLEKLGAHFLAIKDMAGLCRPYAAFDLVKRLKEEIALPIHFHTHDSSGINASSVLKAAEAGVDIADAAVAAMSGGTSQPNLNAIVAALRNTPRDTGLDQATLNECSDYWETVRTYYLPFDSGPKSGNARLYEHEIPGGQYTNLREQAVSMGLGHRWREVEKMYAEVNQLFGDIVKVTPSSKVVGDLALFLVTNDLSADDVLHPKTPLGFPRSVVEMLQGMLGEPDGGWPKDFQDVVLRSAGVQPIVGRPGAALAPADFDGAARELQAKTHREPREEDVLSYLLYPQVFLDFQEHARTYSDTSTIPTPNFFFGLQSGEEISIEIERGKTLIVRYLTTGEVREDGTRTVFFELNGQARDVRVVDRSVEGVRPRHPKAEATNANHVPAPMPGKISSVAVRAGQHVQAGEPLLSIEAMKMETTIYAERPGRIAEVLAAVGTQVKPGELLLKLSPEA
jgi:pyruvate carboxylase